MQLLTIHWPMLNQTPTSGSSLSQLPQLYDSAHGMGHPSASWGSTVLALIPQVPCATSIPLQQDGNDKSLALRSTYSATAKLSVCQPYPNPKFKTWYHTNDWSWVYPRQSQDKHFQCNSSACGKVLLWSSSKTFYILINARLTLWRLQEQQVES